MGTLASLAAGPEGDTSPALIRARWFPLGVAACTAAVLAVLLVILNRWPPHEDETLALFVGRQSLGDLFHTVLGERGGAPLHFLLAWIVAHAGGGLTELRLLSALFAAASVPVVAALCARLGGRAAGLAAAMLACGSWVLLFHGVYGRMYSLFLFTSALSYLALERAVEHGGRRAWALWGIAALLAVASHPYGALVLASQVLYLLLTRERLREAVVPLVAVAALGVPFWIADARLAGRFDVGVGGSGGRLSNSHELFSYLRQAASDYSAGYRAAVIGVLVLALVGLWQLARTRPRSALLVAIAIGTPIVALVIARLGSATSPESRHLIFALPFFSLLIAVGIVEIARVLPRGGTVVAVAVLAALVPAEVAWGWQKTPMLFTGEPKARIVARHAASDWVAQRAQPDDVLFGYEALWLEAWERSHRVSRVVVPRADGKLAFDALRKARKPLGHGVWLFDASDTTNGDAQQLTIPLRLPDPPGEFEARVWGPFLVVRTARPVGTIENFLELSRRVELVGKSLSIGDADINLATVLNAAARLGHTAG